SSEGLRYERFDIVISLMGDSFADPATGCVTEVVVRDSLMASASPVRRAQAMASAARQNRSAGSKVRWAVDMGSSQIIRHRSAGVPGRRLWLAAGLAGRGAFGYRRRYPQAGPQPEQRVSRPLNPPQRRPSSSFVTRANARNRRFPPTGTAS